MDEQKVAAAVALIGHGFIMLAESIDKKGAKEMLKALTAAADAPEDTDEPEPKAPAKKATLTVVKAPAPKAETADDSEEDTSSDAKAKLAKIDLDEAGRNELKELAEALGFDTKGKPGAEIREFLKQAQSGKPGKGGKPPKGKPAKDDEDVEVETPDLDTMREELEVFFKAKRDELGEDFFRKPEKGEAFDADNPCKKLLLKDDDLVEETWNDEVKPLKQADEWDAIVEAAENEVE